MKVQKQTHEDFSIQFTKLALIASVIAIIWLTFQGPSIVYQIIQFPGGILSQPTRYNFLLISGYLVALIGLICIYFLFKLVHNIGNGIIFVPENVRHLQIIGWVTLIFAIIALLCGITCFSPILYLGAMAGFLFLIVRVVRNIFGKAVEMQDELNYTV